MPAITRISIEAELAGRDAALLTFVGLDASASGSNPTFGAAIGFAMQAVAGVIASTPGQVTDADLQAVDPALFYALCDVAEIRVIRVALRSFLQPDEESADRMQAWGKLREQFAADLEALEAQYRPYLNVRRNPTLVGPGRSKFPTPGRRGWAIGRGRYDH